MRVKLAAVRDGAFGRAVPTQPNGPNDMPNRIAAWLLLTLALVAGAADAQPNFIPAPPELAARSWVLMDADSGKFIVAHNADERLPPASLTKLMTSYVISFEVAAGRASNDDIVTIGKDAWAQNPIFKGSSLMWLEPGDKVSLGNLHRGIVVSSGNDACVAAADYLAGSEDAFVSLMNQHARQLGMENTHFVNAHGLPAKDHYSSARDMAMLARAIIKQFPKDYELYSEKEFTYNKIRQTNRNLLLWRDPSVDGLKTGHTQAAGYCLVASAKRDGMRLISAVFGTATEEARVQESQKLLAYGFRYYNTHKLYAAGQKLDTARVWGGAAGSVDLGPEKSVYVTVPRGRYRDLDAKMQIDEVIQAPVKQGDAYGKVVVTLDGKQQAEVPLVAQQKVEPAGFFGRLWDRLMLFFYKLLGLSTS